MSVRGAVVVDMTDANWGEGPFRFDGGLTSVSLPGKSAEHSAVRAKMPVALTDEVLEEQGPGLRAVLAERLEELWDHCQEHLDAPGALKPDPRYAQLGLSIVREQRY